MEEQEDFEIAAQLCGVRERAHEEEAEREVLREFNKARFQALLRRLTVALELPRGLGHAPHDAIMHGAQPRWLELRSHWQPRRRRWRYVFVRPSRHSYNKGRPGYEGI